MRELKLKPCACGKPVDIKYRAGISKEIAKITGMPYIPFPNYYIQCDCGRRMTVEARGAITAEQRDKFKNSIIRAWNKGSK